MARFTTKFSSPTMTTKCMDANRGWVPIIDSDFVVIALADNKDIAEEITALLNTHGFDPYKSSGGQFKIPKSPIITMEPILASIPECHDKCLHCGAFSDECKCDGGIT